MINFDNSFYQLKARNEDGSLMTPAELRAEFFEGVKIWTRWAPVIRHRLNFTVKAIYSGKAWSGMFRPKTRELFLALDWVWPWRSVRKVAAHEIGHSLGIAGHQPNVAGRWDYIMTVGAGGWWRELHPSEARWAIAMSGSRGNRENYHPLVLEHVVQARRARRRYGTLGSRIRELRPRIKELREMNRAGTASESEVRELIKQNRALGKLLDAKELLGDEWDDWKRTVDPTILKMAMGYGSLHKALLPEQRANQSMIAGTPALPLAMLGSKSVECVVGDCRNWELAG